MKLRMFTGDDIPVVEREVNKWVQENKIKPKTIKQTQSSSRIGRITKEKVTISIWY